MFLALTEWFDHMIFLVDDKKKLLWADQNFFRFIKKREKQALGQDLIRLLPFFKSCLASRSAGRRARSDEIRTGEGRLVNVRIVPCGLKPVPGKKTVKCLLGIMQEKRSRNEQTAGSRISDLFVENLMDHVRNYGILLTDNNFRLTRVNKGAEVLFEYERTAMEKRVFIRDLVPDDSRERFQEMLHSLKQVPTVRRELVLKTRPGAPFLADLTAIRIQNDKNDLTGYIFIATDMTEQKKLQKDLEKSHMELARLYRETERANRSKAVFLANMSHELKTPLTAILGFSELLLEQKMGPLNDVQQDFLKDVLTSGKNLLNLINDILDLARIEADKLELNMEEICLQQVIAEARSYVLPLAQEKELRLLDRIPERKILIRADESRIKQVFYNLYSNAFKFTPEKGSVTTDIRLDKDHVLVSLTDTGVGIREEDLPVIFDEFIQIENRFSRKYKGTGLGLALVRMFMQRMEGEITASSPGEGKGSTFLLKFPLLRE